MMVEVLNTVVWFYNGLVVPDRRACLIAALFCIALSSISEDELLM